MDKPRRLRCRRRRRISAALGALLIWGGCSSLLAPHDPQSEARRALEGLSRTGLEIRSTPYVTRLSKLELSEIELDGQDPPSALFHVVASGTYGEAALGYYGSERVIFRRAGGKLLPPESWLPKLEGVMHSLVARDAAQAARSALGLFDLAAPEGRAELRAQSSPVGPSLLAPSGQSDSLSIRIDGDRAEVSSLSAGRGRHVASLQKLGDSWRFTSGLL